MKASLRVGLGAMAVAGCLLAVACSDDDSSGGSGGSGATGGAAGSGGSAGSATGGTSGSGGAGGSGGVSGGGSGGVAGTGGSAGADAGADADDGGGDKFAKIQDLTVTVDCSTDAGDAKVAGAFNVLYDNTAGSAPKGGTLTSSFTFDKSAATMKWNFKPSPGASGNIAAGGTQTVKHITTTTNVSSTDDPCNYCGGTVSVDVSWALDADAGVVTDSFGPVAFVCN